MAWVMECWAGLVSTAHGVQSAPEGQFLKSFGVDAFDGRGTADWTADPDQAIHFASATEVMQAWKTLSTVRPVRPDGKPNRPLTAFSVSPQESRHGTVNCATLKGMTTTKQQPITVYTASEAILHGDEFQTITHALRVARAQFVQDRDTFKTASEGPDTAMYTAKAMAGMAVEFQRYIDRIDLLDAKLGAIEYGPLTLALVGYDRDDLSSGLAQMAEDVTEAQEMLGD